MGAVVVKDVPPGAMVYGNPAKPAARDKAPTGVLPLTP
jgi:acetyltransferase-like isoleucine patch superfamily enzyme